MIQPRTESEFKLRATADFAIEAVDAVLVAAGFRCRADASAHVDVYLDDDCRSLLRAGIGLRLRRGRRGAELCCKTVGERRGALRVREELELPWPGADAPRSAADLPLELRDAVEPYVLGRQLAPLVTLQVEREHRELVHDATDLGELVVDVVTAEAGDRRAAFAEVELEVKDDLPACEHLIERLRERLPLAVPADDKLAHAMTLLDRLLPAPPPPVPDRLGGVLAARWQEQLGLLRAAEAGVRGDRDPEHLHRLRVCLRRLRVLVRAFRAAWPPADAAFLQETLAAQSRSLGELRDRDVALAEFPDLFAVVPEPLRAAGGDLLARLRTARTAARDPAIAALRAPQHVADRARVESLGGTAAMLAEVAALPATDAAGEQLHEAARPLRRMLRDLSPDTPFPALHELRVAIKRLRYLAEELAAARPLADARALRRLGRAQTRLGRLCDHEVAARQYLGMIPAVADASVSPAFAALAGALASLHAHAAAGCRARAIRAAQRLDRKWFWKRFQAPEPR